MIKILKKMTQAFDEEKEATKQRLEALLTEQIDKLKVAIVEMNPQHKEAREDLANLRSNLLIRKALCEFEAEQIVKDRFSARGVIFATITSVVSLLLAISSLIFSLLFN